MTNQAYINVQALFLFHFTACQQLISTNILPAKTNDIVGSANFQAIQRQTFFPPKLPGHVIILFSSFLKSIHAYSGSFFPLLIVFKKIVLLLSVLQVLTFKKCYRKCKAKIFSPSESPRATQSPLGQLFCSVAPSLDPVQPLLLVDYFFLKILCH